MSRSWRCGSLLAVLVLSACGPAASGEIPEVEAGPGTIVSWVASDTQRCVMDGRSWEPLAGACWYPIDLLRDDVMVEVSRWRGGVEEKAQIRIADYPYPVQYITIENDSQVNLSAGDLERVGREQELVGSLWDGSDSPRFKLPLASPLRERGEGGRFGSRRFFNNQPRSPHTGADYRAADGEPVFSVGAGRVVLAMDLFFSGNSVFVDHGDGLVSMYFHLSEMAVAAGDDVGRGEQIGKVGSTGRATGPHLHFGVRWKGARINPELLLAPGGSGLSLP